LVIELYFSDFASLLGLLGKEDENFNFFNWQQLNFTARLVVMLQKVMSTSYSVGRMKNLI